MTILPPQNLEMEESLIASCFLEKSLVSEICGILNHTDFYQTSHQLIFKEIEIANQAGSEFDLATVVSSLREKKLLTKCGGASKISCMFDTVPRASAPKKYALKVKELSIRRQLIDRVQGINRDAYGFEVPTELLLSNAKKAIADLVLTGTASEIVEFADYQMECTSRYEKLQKYQGMTGVTTGYYKIDELTCGFTPGDLIILAARPSMGKTAFAVNMMTKQCREDIPVGFLSLEMTRLKIHNRINAAGAKIDSLKFRSGGFTSQEFKSLSDFMPANSYWQLHIDDSTGINQNQIRSKIQFFVQEKGAQIVYIDYLQLIKSAATYKRKDLEIGDIVQDIKAMAKDFNIPIVLLSQLNRNLESRENKRPRLSDLRESGAIEQEADIVIFLYRRSMYTDFEYFMFRGQPYALTLESLKSKKTDPAVKKAYWMDAEAIFAKHRDGSLGTVKLGFEREFTQFHNISGERNEAGE